jgi:ferredoxin/flavodoxin
MQTTIFYFSGTGNSLKVAQDLAKRIPDSKVTSITRALRQGISGAGKIGIVAPVYMFGLPLIVSEFIKKLTPPSPGYIFAVLTLGGMAGPALQQLKKEVEDQRLLLSAGFLVAMPGNYTPLYGAPSERKQQKFFERQLQKTDEIARIVCEEKTHFDRQPRFFNGLLSAIYKSGAPKIPFLDKEFWVQDSCTSCGLCQKVCPVNNIELVEGKPRWRHRCQYCFACLQWCPSESIQHGKITVGRKRYHHPCVKPEDMINGK